MREILTLENIQVDCRGLTYDQIEKLLSVVDGKLDPLNSSFDVDTGCLYLSFNKYCRLFGFYEFDEDQYEITYDKFMGLFGNKEEPKETLTLENVQVDCTELTKEQVKEMASVFENNGYESYHDLETTLQVKKPYTFIKEHSGCYIVGVKSIKKTTITYEKFMELFTGQVTDVGEMVVEKPQHFSKGIDTFAKMEANCTIEECLAFAKGNIDSYNWSTKEQSKENFEKIISYASWAVKLLQMENN